MTVDVAKATLFIPTRNRAPFLRRALNYYARTECRYPIVVCDSSDPPQKADVAAAAASHPRLNVVLRDFSPDVPIGAKISAGLAGIATRYMAFSGDDDFLVPATMARCVEFLERHPDYAVAHGRAFTFVVEHAGVYGRVTTLRPYRQRTLNQTDPAARLRSHLRDWSTSFYSVQRVDGVRSIFQTLARLSDDPTSCEVFFYATNAIRGKAIALASPYMYRQVEVAKDQQIGDTHVWADAPGWSRLRDRLVGEITGELSAAAGAGPGGRTHYEPLVRTLLDEWVARRRPFTLGRWHDYPPRYYWERALNLGHKLGLRCREYTRPGAEGSVVRSLLQREQAQPLMQNLNGSRA